MPGQQKKGQTRVATLNRAVGDVPEEPRNPLCNDPVQLAWQSLAHQYHELHVEFEKVDAGILASECRAANSVIHRVLRCQESCMPALAAVRAVYTKLCTVLQCTNQSSLFDDRLAALRARLDDLCRLASCEDCKKPASECSCGGHSTECSCTDAPETGFINYGQWLEVERSGSLFEEAVIRFDRTLEEVGPHLTDRFRMDECCTAMKKMTGEFTKLMAAARTATASCDPLAVDDVLRSLHNHAAHVSFTYDRLQCHLGQISCTTQPAFFSILQAEADGIGLIGATLLRYVHKLAAPCSTMGGQLRRVWMEMRNYEAGPLKQAFLKYQDRQLCPQEQCYEKATGELRRLIENGLADSDGLTMDIYGCDEARLYQHRELVDRCVQEIMRLDCKNLEGFDRCVWTRLGSFTMRLYAILGRSSGIVADQVRTLAQSWNNLTRWWNHMDEEPPTDVVPFLRAGLGILRSLEDRAQSHGVCTQLPTGACADYGRMDLRIVDDHDQPMAGCRVHIIHHTGHTREAVADGDGRVREMMPKGPCTISSPGEEFPAFKMTCY